MPKRSKGTKRVLVRKYPRWRKGKRQRVGKHLRGEDHEASVKKTKNQLRLDLGDDD